MKYLYIILILAVFSSCLMIGTGSASSTPIYYGDSFLIEKEKTIDRNLEKKGLKMPHSLVSENENHNIKADSYLVLDKKTLTPLLGKNYNEKKLFASVTKLMTVIVALENSDLSEKVIVNKDFSETPAVKMGLLYGEEIYLSDILKGALISSANDAAEMVAYYIGKGDYSYFTKLMNDKAREIGMKNTNFTNAIGLDNEQNYSTVYDLAILANYALENDFISQTAKVQKLDLKSIDGAIKHELKSTNELLGDKELNVFGLKTGQTPKAGGCLVSIAKTKNGEEIITVVLGSEDRFGDTKKLIQWTEENIEWK